MGIRPLGNLLERSIGHPNDHEVFSSSISKKSATSCFAVPFMVNATPGGKEEVERLERRMDGSPASPSPGESSLFSADKTRARMSVFFLFLPRFILLNPSFPPSLSSFPPHRPCLIEKEEISLPSSPTLPPSRLSCVSILFSSLLENRAVEKGGRGRSCSTREKEGKKICQENDRVREGRERDKKVGYKRGGGGRGGWRTKKTRGKERKCHPGTRGITELWSNLHLTLKPTFERQILP